MRGAREENDRPAKASDYPDCFGCGRDNPHGLGLKLELRGAEVVSEFTPLPHHQGWPGIVHGGIICALLYELMENWGYLNGIVTMARSVDARLRRPAQIGQPIRGAAWLASRHGRDMDVAARLEGEEGVIAEGRASLVEIDGRRRERLGI